jgi:hypothetical protein
VVGLLVLSILLCIAKFALRICRDFLITGFLTGTELNPLIVCSFYESDINLHWIKFEHGNTNSEENSLLSWGYVEIGMQKEQQCPPKAQVTSSLKTQVNGFIAR